ncbi:unnamed protein product [Coffea canephora]|uniref:Secreted protein n=1 Tax=Coffea canephora TaxID=49390 RepID=A0A068TMM1_COFCA|nr:unnamed protein product [Coffea canephora]
MCVLVCVLVCFIRKLSHVNVNRDRERDIHSFIHLGLADFLSVIADLQGVTKPCSVYSSLESQIHRSSGR